MPLTREDFDKASDLNKLKQQCVNKLEKIASRLGLNQEEEVATNGGRVDLVWYHTFKSATSKIGPRLPLVGFEIETSWRTRKHIKGDIFNLLELSPALGIILFLSEGFKKSSKLRGNVDAARRYAKGFSGLSRVVVWTDKDVEEIYTSIR
jgi:hypothetical protein